MSLPNEMVVAGHLGGYLQGGDPGSWCPNLWQWAVSTLQVESVLELGCGEGRATRAFRDLGCRALGIDGCEQAVRDSVVPACVALHDFTHGAFAAAEPCDMIWSCEFLEHVDEAFVPHILQTLAQANKVILITHGLPGQRGHHHVNCRPNSYWIERIKQLGYRCDVALTKRARFISLQDYPSINHFARSGLVFVKKTPGARAPAWGHRLSCKMKDWRINWGLDWALAYRRQRWRRRLRRTP
jgi:SAM-dependent methyltransferase